MKKKATRLLYYCADTGIPFWGTKGGSIHMREFVTNLQQFGYEISVVARNSDREDTPHNSISFHNLPFSNGNISENGNGGTDDTARMAVEMGRFGDNTGRVGFLLDLHSHNNFGIVYERYSLFSIAGLKFARSQNLPFVLEVNAPLIDEASRYRGLVLKDLARSIERNLFTGADHIIAVSSEVGKYISDIAPEAHVTVVPNGVTVEQFAEATTTDAVDSFLTEINDSDFVVGFVGSLKPWHGVDILIDSFAGLPDEGRRNMLLIVGGKNKQKSEFKRSCRSRGLKGRVVFTGAVEHDAIPGLLHGVDVLVAPYPELNDFYFSALKIFEYMAAGKPIVASAIGQIEEILTHEHNALLTPAGDEAALTEAILRLKRDPDLRRKLGANARKEASEKHTWKHRIGTIDEIFQDLLKSGTREIPKKHENQVQSPED